MSTDQIRQAALALPEDERAKLAEELLASLDPPGHETISEAWAREIERRIDDVEAGRVQTRPADEVLRELRERFR